jgi:hypothetical protein
VLVSETTLVGEAREAHFVVTLIGADATFAYEAERMTSTGLRFGGGALLPTNTLVRLELANGQRRLSLWANVTRCVSEIGKWRIEVAPIALGAADKATWTGFFQDLAGGGSAAPPSPRLAETTAAPRTAAPSAGRPTVPAPARSAPAPAPAEKKEWWKPW